MKYSLPRILLISTSLAMGCGSTVVGAATSTDASNDTGQDATRDVSVTDVPMASDLPVITDVPVLTDHPVVVDAGRVPMQHRTGNAACLSVRPTGTCVASSDPAFMCNTDSQCTMGSNGRCMNSPGGPAGCYCTYDTCTTDSQCTMGGPCACHGSPYLYGGNTCLPGNCQIDSECGANGYCSPTSGSNNCGETAGYYCHTPMDTCIDDSDCTGGDGLGACQYDTAAGLWQCMREQICA